MQHKRGRLKDCSVLFNKYNKYCILIKNFLLIKVIFNTKKFSRSLLELEILVFIILTTKLKFVKLKMSPAAALCNCLLLVEVIV